MNAPRARILGIDGGGTKTAFALYETQPGRGEGPAGNLVLVDRLVLGTCHHAQAGFDGMERVLAEGIAWARGVAAGRDAGAAGSEAGDRATRAKAGRGQAPAPDDALGIAFAICGYGEGAEATRRIDGICARLAAGAPHIVVNDVEEAWAAALDARDGIALIAGTGSIAYGACDGRSMRCGGWDYPLGDEGSGGWMGVELLRAFTRQADGRDARGALYELVHAELGLADDLDLIGWSQAHLADRGRVAALSPLVTRAAKAGDPSARDILARAAAEEAAMVGAIVRGIFPDDGSTIPVGYVGGTFNAGAAILEPLARALPARCRLTAPAHEPEYGAALLLLRKMGRDEGER